jgi:Type II CAAX prenyl endopeptidase Rce1-like
MYDKITTIFNYIKRNKIPFYILILLHIGIDYFLITIMYLQQMKIPLYDSWIDKQAYSGLELFSLKIIFVSLLPAILEEFAYRSWLGAKKMTFSVFAGFSLCLVLTNDLFNKYWSFQNFWLDITNSTLPNLRENVWLLNFNVSILRYSILLPIVYLIYKIFRKQLLMINLQSEHVIMLQILISTVSFIALHNYKFVSVGVIPYIYVSILFTVMFLCYGFKSSIYSHAIWNILYLNGHYLASENKDINYLFFINSAVLILLTYLLYKEVFKNENQLINIKPIINL